MITKEHIEILKHTQRNEFFCGGSKEMDELCELKMMKYAFKKPFVPDKYYRITRHGIKELNKLDG